MHRTLRFTLVFIIASCCAAAAATQSSPRSVSPATVTINFPASLGETERPLVEFDHSAHTKALKDRGCETCHRIDDRGVLDPRLAGVLDIEDRDELIDAYHATCTGCHEKRARQELKGGPVTCGECHARRQPGVSTRVAMYYDYSLHARHDKALQDKCENCHHVYDKATETLKYEKGKEEACRPCHGTEDVGRTLSLANASHRSCVSCHLKRVREKLEAGPVVCDGCHDAALRNSIKKLQDIPRLVRGQPDTAWVLGRDAKSAAVAFNHLGHEPVADFCTSCHHETLRPCSDCHTMTGSPEGAEVTAAQSYHRSWSALSCVGCHVKEAGQKSCAGCHRALNDTPRNRTCVICHNGPVAGATALESPPKPAPPRLDPLPATSDLFPETVTLDQLADVYQASTMPHAKIVTKLDEIVRGNPLAERFHADTATLCSGCHHHSPIGTRPPPCRACHSEMADANRDLPGMKVAYHRQCLGCHIEMNIQKQGCSDCHAPKEVAS